MSTATVTPLRPRMDFDHLDRLLTRVRALRLAIVGIGQDIEMSGPVGQEELEPISREIWELAEQAETLQRELEESPMPGPHTGNGHRARTRPTRRPPSLGHAVLAGSGNGNGHGGA